MSDLAEHSLCDLAEAAFRHAAVEVLRRARNTGTPVIVWRDGQVQAIRSDSFDEKEFIAAAEGTPNCSTSTTSKE